MLKATKDGVIKNKQKCIVQRNIAYKVLREGCSLIAEWFPSNLYWLLPWLPLTVFSNTFLLFMLGVRESKESACCQQNPSLFLVLTLLYFTFLYHTNFSKNLDFFFCLFLSWTPLCLLFSTKVFSEHQPQSQFFLRCKFCKKKRDTLYP